MAGNNSGGAEAAATVSTAMVIKNGGNVGIGTTSSSAKLMVKDMPSDGTILTRVGIQARCLP